MLKVEHLVKRFGSYLAISDLNFTLKEGEIVGLLGPNGAGKTTTMRMITSFFYPDLGQVKIDNLDTVTNTLATQAQIGYLPENNPLYPDMLVIDFLLMTLNLSDNQELHQLNPLQKLTFLKKQAHTVNLDYKLMNKIGELSKGYRQRVGLCAALVANPKILILDEPTEGLDPNEREEIRALIKKLAQNRIILISTHVLQEVKALCTKAIVINNGQLIVAGDPAHLTGTFTVEIELEGDKIEAQLKKLIKNKNQESLTLKKIKANRFHATLKTKREIRPELSKLIIANNWQVWQLNTADELDQVFKELK